MPNSRQTIENMQLQLEKARLRECGDGAEVVVDVEHGGV